MKLISLFLVGFCLTQHSYSQTLFTPSGNVGTSSSSNVGVGTSNPYYTFEVEKSDAANNTEYVIGAFNQAGNGGGVYLGYVGDGTNAKEGRVRSGGNTNLAIGTTLFKQALFISNSTGNIGIGTTSPATKLTVDDSNSSLDFYGDSGGNFYLRSNSGEFRFRPNGSTVNQFTLNSSFAFFAGRVGIGTSNPGYTFEVENSGAIDNTEYLIGAFNHDGNGGGIYLGYVGDGAEAKQGRIRSGGNVDLAIGTTTHREVINVSNSSGNVGIGTHTTGSHKLAVEGSIGAREIKVEASGWSDFVFEKDYALRTLEEVEEHIAEKRHLPEIPSEAEVTENGINLGEMDAKLLMKIEELTLYLIEQNKEIKELKEKVKRLENE